MTYTVQIADGELVTVTVGPRRKPCSCSDPKYCIRHGGRPHPDDTITPAELAELLLAQ